MHKKQSLYSFLFLAIGLFLTVPIAARKIIDLSIFDWIQNPGSFATLTQLLSETQTDVNVNKLLDQRTIFAPTDTAFKEFARIGLLDGSQHTENRKKFMNYLIVQKGVPPEVVNQLGTKLPTIAGPQIDTDEIGKILYYQKVKNGYIYVIDQVPVNPELKNIIYPEGKK